MIGIRLGSLTRAGMKAGFFDRAKVLDRMSKATARALSKFGAFVRRRARSSIRKRKAISKPGNPPSSHIGLLKNNIFFAAEPRQENVVIGPVTVNGTKSPTALKALEHGGQTLVFRKFGKGGGTLVQATVAPRPFMKPAFDKELEKAPYLWQNGIRAA